MLFFKRIFLSSTSKKNECLLGAKGPDVYYTAATRRDTQFHQSRLSSALQCSYTKCLLEHCYRAHLYADVDQMACTEMRGMGGL